MSYFQNSIFDELIVDNFAGGGGASTGIELAVGRPVDIAINHDPKAIAMHKVNHPCTQHYQESVWDIDPRKVTEGRPVGIAWFSPDCKHFSKAKGGKPVDKNIRGLAWVALRWASSVRPRIILLENVEEFMTWGPLKAIRHNGRCVKEIIRSGNMIKYITAVKGEVLSVDQQIFEPDKKRAGQTFNKFVQSLRNLGYQVEWRILKACDYGTPTIRKRFYLIARCDGMPIVWPEPTHGEGKQPYRTAAECIDWSIPCPSIFGRKKDLAVNTQRRIARGLDKFVLKNPRPFIMEMNYQNTPQDPEKPLTTQTAVNKHFIINPSIVPVGYGERAGQAPRVHDIKDPLTRVVSSCKQNLVTFHLSNRYGDGKDGRGTALDEQAPTLTGTNHTHLVAADIVHYYGGADHASDPQDPLATVTALPRHYLTEEHLLVFENNVDNKSYGEPLPTMTQAQKFANVRTYLRKIEGAQDLGNWHKVRELLNNYAGYNIADDEILILLINSIEYFIADIGMRMLKAFELKLAQGFPVDYCIDIESKIGKPYSEAKQIARLGNAVCPPVAMALVKANYIDVATKSLQTMAQLAEYMNQRYRRQA